MSPKLHSSWCEAWSLVVADRRIVRIMSEDEFYFFLPDLRIRSNFRLPKYLSSDGEVPSLLEGKILRYDSVICAAEVSNAVSEIHPDINLAIRVCDLVD